ncbi:hypothetical protein [Sphingomonas sp. LH128]|uniref:hypothetical protein n=1 Tax=Sphingomonas sp. LH128 TaxID=473781 RepID=UPI00155E444D|nr:hypothetical protein [Sphingomonas sp. LH128]
MIGIAGEELKRKHIEIVPGDRIDAHGFDFRDIPFEQAMRKYPLVFHEKQRNDEMPGRKSQCMSAAEMVVEPGLGVAGLDLAQPARADPDLCGKPLLGDLLGSSFHFDAPPRHLLDRLEYGRIACVGYRPKRHDQVSLANGSSSHAQPV